MNEFEKLELEKMLKNDISFTEKALLFIPKKYSQKEVREVYKSAVKYGYEMAVLNGRKFDVKIENTSEFYKEFLELCKKHNAIIDYNIHNGGLYFRKNVPCNQ